MELLGIEVSFEEFDYLMCEQSKGKELVVEDGKVIARDRIIAQEELNQNKIAELDNWFKTDYLKYEQMFTRREALGKTDIIEDEFRNRVGENAYHSLIELYEEAEIVASEIRELRKNKEVNDAK